MASEQSGDTTVELSIPVALGQWLDAKASEWQVDRETLVRQLLTAYHVTATLERADDGSVELDGALGDDVDDFLGILNSTSHSLDSRFSQLERRFTADLEDVRKRVIQLKRETDTKASSGHRHTDIVEHVHELESAIESTNERLESIVEGLEAVENRMDGGFENYRGILEHLADQADDLDSRLEKVATVLIRYRDDITAVSQLVSDHERLESITGEAIKNGIRTAECEQCGTTIDIGLLSRPFCPECTSRFETVIPKDGFFGKSRLEIEDPPALETADEFDGFQFGGRSKFDEIERESSANTDESPEDNRE